MPADHYGCGHYRLIWAAEVLRHQDIDVTVLDFGTKSGLQARVRDLPDGSAELVSVAIPQDADIIVVQRPAYPLQPQMIRMLRENHVAVVVDMDDDMSAIHPGNVAYHTYRHDNGNTPYSWRYAGDSCKEATLVTTSTARLQKVYAKHGRGVVIDNYVPEATLHYPKTDTGAFGWAGTTLSHPADLQVLGRAAQQLVDDGHDFRVVGPDKKVKECLRLEQTPHCTGTVGLDVWIQTIAQTYDVGMVPLEVSTFNSAKSRLKGIEHMAAGVPWVASPREEYRRLHKESGCGLLADTPREWYKQVKRLLTDDTLRKEQVEMGRAYMKDQTIQAQAWRWAEAWEHALKIQRG